MIALAMAAPPTPSSAREVVLVSTIAGVGEGSGDLRGTQIAAGAQDIAADGARLRSYRCGGCGGEVDEGVAPPEGGFFGGSGRDLWLWLWLWL